MRSLYVENTLAELERSVFPVEDGYKPRVLTSIVFRNRGTGRVRQELADPDRLFEIKEFELLGYYEIIAINGEAI